ncbi:MAG: LytTR family DNA-binding domain-containing protein [Bacilli bacterium]|nr:LytTR family DNA-binding domain-containing protein [Bacilli bacterium]MDD4643964.1 LytTR family DNA-binding domain-containing protein [Bacilli bacterium]
MLHFVVCDDNAPTREKVNKVITKLMLPSDAEYKTLLFSQYDKSFIQFIDKKVGKKIYILDVEVNFQSGLDVARKIREKDWESIIIILTAHYELAYNAFKNRLMLLDFISKFDDYEHNLYETLKLALKAINVKKQLSFEFNRISYKIDLDDILYIIKDTAKRNSIIKTFAKEYSVALTLNEIIKMLPNSFIQTHRACIINKDNVKNIDFKSNVITFNNNEKITLLSKTYKKDVKQYVFN